MKIALAALLKKSARSVMAVASSINGCARSAGSFGRKSGMENRDCSVGFKKIFARTFIRVNRIIDIR